jgi:hypothetical protein
MLVIHGVKLALLDQINQVRSFNHGYTIALRIILIPLQNHSISHMGKALLARKYIRPNSSLNQFLRKLSPKEVQDGVYTLFLCFAHTAHSPDQFPRRDSPIGQSF